jgi:hypothetical protein
MGDIMCSCSFTLHFSKTTRMLYGLKKAKIKHCDTYNRLYSDYRSMFPYGNPFLLIPLCPSNNFSHLCDFLNGILHFNTPNVQFRKEFRQYNNGILYSMEVHFNPKDVGNAAEYCTCLLLGHSNRSRGRKWCLSDATTLQLRCSVLDILVWPPYCPALFVLCSVYSKISLYKINFMFFRHVTLGPCRRICIKILFYSGHNP